jgi:hypothetical protein
MKLDLNVEEANKVLEALSEKPFKEVYILIAKIKNQAEEQMNAEQQPETPLEGEVIPPM